MKQTFEAELIKKNSKFLYFHTAPHRRVLAFHEDDYSNLAVSKRAPLTFIDLPLPHMYYLIMHYNYGVGSASYRPILIASSPVALDSWDEDHSGYVIPLPDISYNGTVCFPRVLRNPDTLIDDFWEVNFNVFEYPAKTHHELCKWAGVTREVSSHQTPPLSIYEKWSTLELEDLPNQKWLWSSPIQNAYYL